MGTNQIFGHNDSQRELSKEKPNDKAGETISIATG